MCVDPCGGSLMPSPHPPPWMAYVGIALTASTIGWGAITQWFTLQQRVHDLELRERYVHGTFEMPKTDQ